MAQEQLDYQEAVARPAAVVYDFVEKANNVTAVPLFDDKNKQHPACLEGVEDAFVIPNVLSTEECDEWISLAEEDGIVPPLQAAGTLRTAKRTDNYQNELFSETVKSRIESHVLPQLSNTERWGEFHGVHSNWRILRYDPQDAFPVHQDQMDSIQKLNKESGIKDMLLSTHTLLINLSDTSDFSGGATRFYPHAGMKGSLAAEEGAYDYAIDICLPRGWALIFPQLGMLHAGQPVHKGKKYVAQAGILRTLPRGRLMKPYVFKFGPTLGGLFFREDKYQQYYDLASAAS